MTGNGSKVIRLGVVGLGRLWDARFKPAVARLRDRFEVTAVFDQVARRAEIEAKLVRCRAVGGLAALVECPDVDAVALLAPQWFGMRAVELVARAGKPIYLGVPLSEDLGELDRLDSLILASGVPTTVEYAPRSYPANLHLRELLRTTLGPVVSLSVMVRVGRFDRSRPLDPGVQVHPGSILSDPGQALVDWVRSITGGGLADVEASTALTVGDGEPAGWTFRVGGVKVPNLDFTVQVVEDDGSPTPGVLIDLKTSSDQAHLRWPLQVDWSEYPTHRGAQVAPGPSVGEWFLDQFHRMIGGQDHLAPTWLDGSAAARTVAAIRRSFALGRRVSLGIEPGRPDDSTGRPG